MHPPTRHTATVELLTDGRWLAFLRSALEQPHSQLLLSIYMISPWWNTEVMGESLLTMMCQKTRQVPKRHCLLSSLHPTIEQKHYNMMAAKRLIDAGWKIRIKKANHEKLWIIGTDTVIIGSHNLSYTGATTDSDSSAAIHSATLAQEATSRFWSRWARAANLIVPGDPAHGQNRLDQLTPRAGRRLPQTGTRPSRPGD